MKVNASISEDRGIAAMPANALRVYSVGISTGGIAEMRMAAQNKRRKVTSTTVDPEGVEFAKKQVSGSGMDNQIEVKLEDVAKPLPYPDGYFDYIYARLVLHYLDKTKLREALQELPRVLTPGGFIFVVVRSTKCPDATQEGAIYDPVTGLTSSSQTEASGKTYSYSRYFHTPESIATYMTAAKFTISHVSAYDEKLFKDFMRKVPSDHVDNVIEVLASK